MQTREEWLNAAVDELRPIYGDVAKVPPVVKVSIGFPPKGGLAKRRVLGVCCSATMAADRHPQIYINPTIADVEGKAGILAVLAHELIHACGISGHGKEFRKVALYIGLEGDMTCTTAGESLMGVFEHIMAKIGTMPHAYLTHEFPKSQKPDTCRMLKCACEGCGYTVRISQKWFEVATPKCPVCDVELEKEDK